MQPQQYVRSMACSIVGTLIALFYCMHTPSLRFLKTFHIAAKRGSFKAAADELCVTVSAISHQIKVLEIELGLALFERGPRSLALTEAGGPYLEDVGAVVSRL